MQQIFVVNGPGNLQGIDRVALRSVAFRGLRFLTCSIGLYLGTRSSIGGLVRPVNAPSIRDRLNIVCNEQLRNAPLRHACLFRDAIEATDFGDDTPSMRGIPGHCRHSRSKLLGWYLFSRHFELREERVDSCGVVRCQTAVGCADLSTVPRRIDGKRFDGLSQKCVTE